jgi:uncharacterized membrane protein
MRKSMIPAAAIATFAALMLSAPANAIENYGPNKVGNQCFTASPAWGRDLAFGNWGACPQTASVAAPTRAKKQAHHR